MKHRLIACSSAVLISLLGFAVRAQPAPAEAAPAAPATASSTEETVKTELSALVDRVKQKLQAGQATEAALADELKAFDALAAKFAEEKTDAVAMIRVMKARLYLEVFDNAEVAITQLKQIAVDFPASSFAKQIPMVIAQVEQKIAAEAATAVGKPFAPFKETATDGSVIDLAAYQGKVVLIDFWATWCGPCVEELPNVLAAYASYHDKGFEIIGISLDKDGDALSKFTKEKNMPWPQFFDGKGWQNKLAQAYGIQSIPATFLLDREGKIAAKGLRGSALSAKVGELLGATK